MHSTRMSSNTVHNFSQPYRRLKKTNQKKKMLSVDYNTNRTSLNEVIRSVAAKFALAKRLKETDVFFKL